MTTKTLTGFHAIIMPGTLRDSLFILDGLLGNTTVLDPQEIMAHTAGYSDVIFGLFWLLGYQFSPRLADVGWSYGTLQSDLGPPRPEGLDETAAALLDEAEDIVNAVGPEILAEFRQQDERRGLGAWLGRLKRRR